eukprot:467088-Rhodomonas_salina.2
MLTFTSVLNGGTSSATEHAPPGSVEEQNACTDILALATVPVFAGHETQLCDVLFSYCPDGHRHGPGPAQCLYVPPSQATQGPSAGPAYPGLQVQAVPSWLVPLFAGHATHALEDPFSNVTTPKSAAVLNFKNVNSNGSATLRISHSQRCPNPNVPGCNRIRPP